MNESSGKKYGHLDTSYKAAGELEGLTTLVETFYDIMSAEPLAQKIRKMHPEDLTHSKVKLVQFLSGWLGGPKRPPGQLPMPRAHLHLDIKEPERDAWLFCMKKALDAANYENTFKEYLIEQLFVPAERIRALVAQKNC